MYIVGDKLRNLFFFLNKIKKLNQVVANLLTIKKFNNLDS